MTSFTLLARLHINALPPLVPGNGPIAFILAPYWSRSSRTLEPISFNPYLAPYVAAWFTHTLSFIWHSELLSRFTHPLCLFLLGLRTRYFYLGYVPPFFVWVYAPSIFIWVYAPTIFSGTMHPHLPLGLFTLVYHRDYAPSLPLGLRTLHFCLGYHTYLLGLHTLYLCLAYAPVIQPLASYSFMLYLNDLTFFDTLRTYYLSFRSLRTQNWFLSFFTLTNLPDLFYFHPLDFSAWPYALHSQSRTC
jgi:hypothetical protein